MILATGRQITFIVIEDAQWSTLRSLPPTHGPRFSQRMRQPGINPDTFTATAPWGCHLHSFKVASLIVNREKVQSTFQIYY